MNSILSHLRQLAMLRTPTGFPHTLCLPSSGRSYTETQCTVIDSIFSNRRTYYPLCPPSSYYLFTVFLSIILVKILASSKKRIYNTKILLIFLLWISIGRHRHDTAHQHGAIIKLWLVIGNICHKIHIHTATSLYDTGSRHLFQVF